MRQISIDAAKALMNGKTFKRGNTEVNAMFETVFELSLFGHPIARYDTAIGILDVTTAGWNTVTTKDRLNAIPGVNVRTKRGQLFLNDWPWNGKWINPELILTQTYNIN